MILGIGIDIIEIDRVQKAIDRWGEHFLNHVFTKEEIAYCQKHKLAAQHFAVRFAAKEAIYKALNDTTISWQDITILNKPDSKPYCIIHRDNFTHKICVSLSHSRTHAIANAIVTA